MKNFFNFFYWPLILGKSIDINVDNPDKIFTERYKLDIIDYQDMLLNTKLVYDIVVKKITINQNWEGLLGTE